LFDENCNYFYCLGSSISNISITIEPSGTDIYRVNRIMNVYCTVSPMRVITNNLLINITLISNNTNVIRLDERKMQIPGTRLGTICFNCGHRLIQVSKCYRMSGESFFKWSKALKRLLRFPNYITSFTKWHTSLFPRNADENRLWCRTKIHYHSKYYYRNRLHIS